MLLPTFKSVIDFAMLSYINFLYEIDLPFVTGLKEFDEINIFSRIMRRWGAYFINTKNLNDKLYKVILEEMFGQMMKNRLILEYHISRRRQRSGKSTAPDDFVFEEFISAYLRNHDDIEDLMLVPITINYDKVYESDYFPYELLGEQKPKESLFKIVKQILISKQSLGRVIIKYCKPISLDSQISQFCEQNGIQKTQMYRYHTLTQEQTAEQENILALKKKFSDNLQKEIVYIQTENSMIMATSLVASIILFDRKTGISEEELLKKGQWVYQEIKARDGLTGF